MEIIKYVNKDLRSLSKWLNSNKISRNITKTEVLIFKGKGTVFDVDLKLRLCVRDFSLVRLSIISISYFK